MNNKTIQIISAAISHVILIQLHIDHCITLGLLLIEITIMCAKGMVQVWKKEMSLRCGIIALGICWKSLCKCIGWCN